MPELELEGYTLGHKHRHYNKLVQDALKNNQTVDATDFKTENGDIINLINIDIASRQKNVEYILKVFTCDDILYVSKAIGRSKWLIGDQNYAHIINPNYLNTNIFPQMTTKAIIKLMKFIKHNLNNERRAEEFYSYEEDPKEAVTWLPYCSLKFIEDNIKDHLQHLKTTLLKRLCEKSITVLEIYLKNDAVNKNEVLQSNIFLLTTNANKYLDLVEAVPEYLRPTFNKKSTRLLMKNNYTRIITKFEMYYSNIHFPTFISYLKKENIKDFLLNQAQSIEQNNNLRRLFNLKRLILFVKSMPQEIRFEFVKQVFIDKKHLDPKENCSISEKERKGMNILCLIICEQFRYYEHIWYQFAPYDVAFQNLTELVGTVTTANLKKSILGVLLLSAECNLSHERAFLEYLRDKQKKLEYNIKEHLLTKLLSNFNFLRYEQSTWIVLEDIFKSMDIYTESENGKGTIIDAIVLYKVIHQDEVPEIVEKKFDFNTLVCYHKKLDEKDKEIVYKYLYNLITAKLAKVDATNETDFKEKISTLEQVLNLMKDYKKELERHPDIISVIKDLLRMKNMCFGAVSMESLFNINKKWRKLLFEESLTLCPTESVLINALKHGPSLLEGNKDVLHNMLCNDKMNLQHVLGKIKIYWSNSIAKNITVMYTEKLNLLKNHKALTQGLSILLSKNDLHDLIKQYAPKEAQINWDKIGEVELSVQQQFAKKMHIARPQPVPETVLWFAKGDYLQYALPSLLSIFYNLNSISSRKYIPGLLNAPVSLQKHGIRLAISKMEIREILSSFSNIWKNNKNASIRSVMFKNVHTLLCKEKDLKKIKAGWELMEMFIDNLTFQEDKSIYKLLFKVENIPLVIRGKFYMKCYNFLRNLVNSGNDNEEFKRKFYTSFAAYSLEITEQLQPYVIPEIICEFVDREFTKNQVDWTHYCIINVISSYLLNSNDEKTQMEKYEKILLPILKQSFTLWSVVNDRKCFVRYNLASLLNKLRCDMQYHVDKKRIVPHKMFSLIQEELELSLPASENYIFLTKWALTASFTVILATHVPILNWEEACMKAATQFGDKCNDYLRDDCDRYYPSIYLLFVKALKSMIHDFVTNSAHWTIYRGLIHRKNFIPGYLATIELLPDYPIIENGEKEEMKKFINIISENPETEIRMHFYNKYQSANEIIEG